jgi:hypothetical protein
VLIEQIDDIGLKPPHLVPCNSRSNCGCRRPAV